MMRASHNNPVYRILSISLISYLIDAIMDTMYLKDLLLESHDNFVHIDELEADLHEAIYASRYRKLFIG